MLYFSQYFLNTDIKLSVFHYDLLSYVHFMVSSSGNELIAKGRNRSLHNVFGFTT